MFRSLAARAASRCASASPRCPAAADPRRRAAKDDKKDEKKDDPKPDPGRPTPKPAIPAGSAAEEHARAGREGGRQGRDRVPPRRRSRHREGRDAVDRVPQGRRQAGACSRATRRRGTAPTRAASWLKRVGEERELRAGAEAEQVGDMVYIRGRRSRSPGRLLPAAGEGGRGVEGRLAVGVVGGSAAPSTADRRRPKGVAQGFAVAAFVETIADKDGMPQAERARCSRRRDDPGPADRVGPRRSTRTRTRGTTTTPRKLTHRGGEDRRRDQRVHRDAASATCRSSGWN